MKVGLCGFGDRIGYLAELFRLNIPDFEPVAYADPATEPCGFRRMDSEFARHLRGYKGLEAMLDRERLDLLLIGSPNVFHCEHLDIALDAGLKVFCEKPVVVSEEETIGLLKKLNQYGTDRVMVGLVLRYAPLYKDLVRLHESGALGEIMSIDASEHIRPAHGAFFFRDWRRKTELSGGFLLEKCCHDLDLYAGLVKSRPMRVASFGGCSFFTKNNQHLENQKRYKRWPSNWNHTDSSFAGDSDIVDHQTALIEYENGVRLSFHTNLHAPNAIRRFCVIGSKGMAEGDFAKGHLKAHRASTREIALDKQYTRDGMSIHYGAEAEMAEDVSSHLHKGTPLPVSVIDALEAGLTAIRIDDARRSGQVLEMSGTWKRFDSAINL